MSLSSIRVVIVDDQSLVRAGFKMLIDSENDLTTVGEAKNGADGIAVVKSLRPDVVMMDIRMPVMDGIAAAQQICSDSSLDETKVLIVTTFDDDANLVEALRVGASGFVGKDAPPGQVLGAIRALHRGDGVLVPESIRSVVAQTAMSTSAEATQRLGRLTPREQDIVEQIGRGLSNDEIAERLFIGASTVKTHINRVLSKSGARDRAQVVVLAYESGLLAPGAVEP